MTIPMLARYEKAHTILSRYGHTIKSKRGENNHIIRNDTVYPHWVSQADGSESNCFWYRRETTAGKEYRMVDINAENNAPAFDHLTGIVAKAA